jgi:hypothetical protein
MLFPNQRRVRVVQAFTPAGMLPTRKFRRGAPRQLVVRQFKLPELAVICPQQWREDAMEVVVKEVQVVQLSILPLSLFYRPYGLCIGQTFLN